MIDTHIRSAPPGVGDRADGGTFVDIDGDLLWHFQGGDPMGPPTVLLHGSFSSASSWGAQVGDFADAGLRLFVPERSGHGHSPDRPGRYTFASMAQQVIAYLENVVRTPANLVGWSDGGVLALMVARRRPDLVARLVVTGSYVNRRGLLVSELFDRLGDDDEQVIACLRDSFLYDDAEADAVFDKTVAMLRVEWTSTPPTSRLWPRRPSSLRPTAASFASSTPSIWLRPCLAADWPSYPGPTSCRSSRRTCSTRWY